MLFYSWYLGRPISVWSIREIIGLLGESLISKKAPRTLQSMELSLLGKPRVKTETFGKRSFEYAAPQTWNTLPLHIRQSKDITIFKKVLKTNFFGQAFKF